MEKIYIPYKERYGKKVWPDNARLAVAMYIAVEEWGDETMVKYHHAPSLAPGLIQGLKKADLAITSTIEYGFRVGIWRLMDIWEKHNIKLTLLTSALAAERHPDVLKELVKRGHEVTGHGYDQGRFLAQMTREEQLEDIKKSVSILESVTGQRPKGWGSPGTRQTEETLELLADEGFMYHMGLHDDELPYIIKIKGKTMIEIPYRIVDTGELNDYSMYSRGDTRITSEAITYMKTLFDGKYEEAANIPQFVSFGMHPYVSGRSDRAKVVREFIRYIKGFPDVWIARFGDVAKWWKENYLLV